jgi:uncharacterized protein with PQ loop repeat
MQGLYVARLQTSPTDPNTNIDVRVGYLGICIEREAHKACIGTSRGNASSLLDDINQEYNQQIFPATDSTLLSLIDFSLVLQRQVYFPLTAIAGFLFFVGLVFLVIATASSKGANKISLHMFIFCKRAALMFLLTATVICYVSAYTSTQLTHLLKLTSTRSVSFDMTIEAGQLVFILQWLTAGFSTFLIMGTMLMLSSNR